jgi:hypothetical protein
VKVSREHHLQGKTLLAREHTKNEETRRIKLDRGVIEVVRDFVAENRIGPSDLIFPVQLVVSPRAASRVAADRRSAAGGAWAAVACPMPAGSAPVVPSKMRQQLPPARLASYMARSACTSRVGRSPPGGHSAMPMLTL